MVARKLSRSVVESLLKRCFRSPLALEGSSGMMASNASGGFSSPFPARLEVAIYERDILSATQLPTSACAWGVISGHRGDIGNFLRD